MLKVKLATAIIGISSIHLLKTFINAASTTTTKTMIVADGDPHHVPVLRARRSPATDRLLQHDLNPARIGPQQPEAGASEHDA